MGNLVCDIDNESTSMPVPLYLRRFYVLSNRFRMDFNNCSICAVDSINSKRNSKMNEPTIKEIENKIKEIELKL